MTSDAFRRLALSFAEAHEAPHMERTSFRVGKKIFATMTADGKEAMISVKPPAVAEALIEEYPDMFFSYGGWTTKLGCLGVRLSKAKVKMVEQLLHEAWARIAPKRASR